MAFSYMIHGIVLTLPFPCADLDEGGRDVVGGLRVAAGEVPRELEHADVRQVERDLLPTCMLFRGGPRSARFLAENGTTITFEKNPRCEEPLFLHHLLCPVMAGALWQRGLCVLHASSVIAPQGAVLVTGQSGAGKSTTVARLLAEGWPLQTDEISAVDANAGGLIEVRPGARNIQLNEQSSVHLGFDTRGLARHNWQRQKMAVPARVAETRQSEPVAQIVFLRHAPEFSVQTVHGHDKLATLLEAIYGPVLPDNIPKLDGLLGRALRQIEMIAIGRPVGRWTTEEIVSAIRDG